MAGGRVIPRYTSLRPTSLADALAQREKARERKRKRLVKQKQLQLGPQKSVLFKQLDHLCSLIVRRRDRRKYAGLCLVCVAKKKLGFTNESPRPIEVCYHVIPRAGLAIRWKLLNMLGSCSACNLGEKWSRTNPVLAERYRQIHCYLLGPETLADLERQGKERTNFSTADLIERRESLKKILETGEYQ